MLLLPATIIIGQPAGLGVAPVEARTKSQAAADQNAVKMEAVRRALISKAANARREAIVRSDLQKNLHRRMMLIQRANLLVEQRQRLLAADAAARVRAQIAASAELAADQRIKARANLSKWANGKFASPKFQGVVPPEELKALEEERRSLNPKQEEPCPNVKTDQNDNTVNACTNAGS